MAAAPRSASIAERQASVSTEAKYRKSGWAPLALHIWLPNTSVERRHLNPPVCTRVATNSSIVHNRLHRNGGIAVLLWSLAKKTSPKSR